jgi:ABC-type branched-subunit amino acid transport system substrate-binding protein
MSSAEYFNAAGDAAAGSIFVSTFSASDTREDIQTFVKKYEKVLGQKPDHNHAQSYDTVQIIKQALTGLDIKNTDESLEADRTLIRDALASKIKNYKGLTGTCTFGTSGSSEDRDGMKTCSVYSMNSDGTFKLLKGAS